jgi:colanic acid biosynthesis glycosyl transferase WcaI
VKILLLNQCFYPDVVSTAQHAGDLACGLVKRGHKVTVIASSRGYDDPSLRFPKKESWNSIQIYRVPCFATGKGSRGKRALNIASFFLSCFGRLVPMRRFDVVIGLTSPPLISALGAMFVRLAGGRFIFWIMDLNPDEAIAAGWLREGSRTARVLESALRFSAHGADRVVVLDRFMRDRMIAKGLPPEKVFMLPPWSHDNEVRYDLRGRETFRERHGLKGKYVVMYSGNHSPCHPLDTILEAARELADQPRVAFCFVGGGSELRKVRDFADRHELRNVVCLPYQPLAELSGSLSAADLHLVVMGRKLAGLVHPCKIYNVLALGIPVLYVGPDESHVGDIADGNPALPITRVNHGEVAAVVNRIRAGERDQVAGRSEVPNEDMREAARAFSLDRLVPLYAAVIEAGEVPALDCQPAAVVL